MKKFLLVFAALALTLNFALAKPFHVVVKGTVTDTEGKPVVGAVMSDGVHFTKTDKKGHYTLKSYTKVSSCVFVIPSSEYEVPTNKYGKYNGYLSLVPQAEYQQCDFKIYKRRTPCERYSVIFQADPQSMSSRLHSVQSWDWVADKLNKFKSQFIYPVYQVILGDMVTNEMEVSGMADKFLETFKKIGLKTLFVPGNHDHVHDATNFKDATSAYVKYFGPYNYAMNIGGVHYLFLDSCAWGEGGKKSYATDFNDETIAFIKGDLAFVPMDTPIVICTHCPITQSLDGEYPHLKRNIKNYDKFIALMKGRKVNMWYGHTHINANNAYTDYELAKYAPGLVSLDSHIVGRVGGAWSCSGEITMDGAPRGVAVMEVNGKDISWRYHSLEEKYPEDFNVYTPGCFLDGGFDYGNTLFCNVYMWDEKWENPRWYENGELVGEMEKCIESKDAANDPLYKYLYAKWDKAGLVDNEVRAEPSKASYCNHLFKITPSEGVRSGEIRFRDRFGRELYRKVSW